MAKKKLPPQPKGGFRFPWYFREWLNACEVSQAELERKTDFSKATVSNLVNGRLQYSQTHLDAIAQALNARPYELLLPPAEAFAIRKIIAGHEELDAMRGLAADEPVALRIWRSR